MALKVHPLVKALAAASKAPAIAAMSAQQGSARAYQAAANLPKAAIFAGFLGEDFDHDGKTWRPLFIDLELAECALIEEAGIIANGVSKEDALPFNHERDVLWVNADAPVGRVDPSLDIAAQFLTGEFTRAGDFDVGPAGGTPAGATGVFCEARTPSCCLFKSKRP